MNLEQLQKDNKEELERLEDMCDGDSDQLVAMYRRHVPHITTTSYQAGALAVIEQEIEYWKGVFDKRPKDRDLESDNIAQNFARIEIERLEKKLATLEAKLKDL